jgi:hypothetical protein
MAGAALLSRIAKGGLLVSIALAAIALSTQRLRYIHAYFVASGFLTSLGLGALFFVLLHHLLKARWSVIASRHMQWVATLLPWCVLLFLPNLLWAREIFPWMASGATTNLPETDKIGYLHAPWFFARTAAYWAIWTWLSWWYTGPKSRLEGAPESERHIERCRRFSGPALLLFAITTTFASFDWFMSLQPNWHSAIFGVYIFAGAVPSALAMLALFTVLLERLGVIRATYNVATRHDIAKLLFGFIMFWAYIAFSQYLLIWYAGISLETSFYRLRFNNDWLSTTLWLFTLQFVVPFVALLSASAKRTSLVLFAVSSVVVIAHALDIFWLVMPALESGHPRLCFADFAAATLPMSALLLLLAKGIASESQMPQQTQLTSNFEPLPSL